MKMNIWTIFVGVFAACIIAQCSAAPQFQEDRQSFGGGIISTLSQLVQSVLGVLGLDGRGGGLLGNVVGGGILRGMGGDADDVALASINFPAYEKSPGVKQTDSRSVADWQPKKVPKLERATSAIPKLERATTAIPKQEQTTTAIPKQERTTTAIPKQEQTTTAIPKQGQVTTAIPIENPTKKV